MHRRHRGTARTWSDRVHARTARQEGESAGIIMNILIVDDAPRIRESLADALSGPGTEVRTVASGQRALDLLESGQTDLVLADVRMPGLDGVELLRRIRIEYPFTEVVLMTAYDEMPVIVEAMREGAREFLVKPLDLGELRAIVDRLRREREGAGADAAEGNPVSAAGSTRAPAADDPEAYRPGRLVGRDPGMIRVFKVVGQAASNRLGVLIRGETGTGKELIARAIHFNSKAADQPFVPVNCTALPTPLLESELFGHVKGAFTGAVSRRKGRFAAAGRGTLLLDEVGDTSMEFQAKLLRVLEEREYYPVGADRPEPTEARILTATHRDLEAAVRRGEFRADLYFRLRVMEVRIPPLRERKSDIPELVDHLRERIGRTLGRLPMAVSDEALAALKAHDWPGNVRELHNCLIRAVVVAGSDTLYPQDLDLIGPTDEPGAAPGRLATLDDMEAEHVGRVLEATGGNKTRAAEILAISRPRLRRLIKKHGIDDPDP